MCFFQWLAVHPPTLHLTRDCAPALRMTTPFAGVAFVGSNKLFMQRREMHLCAHSTHGHVTHAVCSARGVAWWRVSTISLLLPSEGCVATQDRRADNVHGQMRSCSLPKCTLLWSHVGALEIARVFVFCLLFVESAALHEGCHPRYLLDQLRYHGQPRNTQASGHVIPNCVHCIGSMRVLSRHAHQRSCALPLPLSTGNFLCSWRNRPPDDHRIVGVPPSHSR